jgi:hypothetical protein
VLCCFFLFLDAQPELRSLIASMFKYVTWKYESVIKPYAIDSPTAKDFVTNPESWDIYLHVAGLEPRVSLTVLHAVMGRVTPALPWDYSYRFECPPRGCSTS